MIMYKTATDNGRKKYLKQMVAPDYVLEIREGKEFTEFVVSTGGDISTYRVYGSGGRYSITCK